MPESTDFIPPATPWPLLAAWFEEAKTSEPSEPNAMSLATVGADGMPSARIMLLKDYDENGFVFYTNRQSRKGRQLAEHAMAALCFHWKSLGRQVRVEGSILPVSDAESDAYFATRPRGSQIGAWASQQSKPLLSRVALEQKIADIEKQYEGKPVPRPPHWGGYRLTPNMIELWQNGAFRLHDRFVYRRISPMAAWVVEREYP